MHPFLSIALFALCALFALLTLASEIETNVGLVRMMDFPRALIATVSLLLSILALSFARGHWRTAACVMGAAAAAWQMYRIAPYTKLASPEVERVRDWSRVPTDDRIRVLTLNVLQTNRDRQRTIELIDEIDPDALLLTETDEDWSEALATVLDRYPHRIAELRDNLYGILFCTRLPVRDAEIRHLIERDTPSVFARLTTRSGQPFHLIGLHPRPPRPNQGTVGRDAEIARAAEIGNEVGEPVLTVGDFNDVGWSSTSRLFRRIGGYLDPRIGRGTFASFPASWPAFRWPLDHVYVSPEFRLIDMRVLRNVGSDHLPIVADLVLDGRGGPVANGAPEEADAEDEAAAREAIRKGRDGG